MIARLARGSEKLSVCFTGHLDTVPLGTTAWAKDAFAGETAGDKLFGRGRSDMKSGVAAIMLMALRPARFPARQAGLTIIFTAGMAHKIDEFCHVSKIDFAAEAYTEIAKKWCGVQRDQKE